MGLIEKIVGMVSRQPPVEAGSGAQRSAAPHLGVRPAPPQLSSPGPALARRRYLAELRRYEVETDELVAGIRDKDERRKNDRVDQWILFALIAIAAIALLGMDQEEWSPYLSPTLIAGALLRLVWVTRGRGRGSSDSS